MTTGHVTATVDAGTRRWVPTALRWTAAALWLANVNWKVPPDFGRGGGRCVALCRFVEAGAEFPVAPGSRWFFENVASPNLGAFGWTSLLVESVLVVLLASGRYVRSAAVLGVAMSVGIGLAVANAEHEWYWAYLLMVALHLAILATAPMERAQPAPVMAAVTVAYGLLVVIAHAGAGITGSGDWMLFSQDSDLPGDWGRSTFPGSVAIGLGLVVVGVVGWFVADRVGPRPRRVVGWALVAVAALLLVTYRQDGLVIGLGSRPGNACMLAALGLAIAVPTHRRATDQGPLPSGTG